MAVYIAELRQCRLTYYGEDGADKGGSYSVEAKLRDPDFPDADHWVDYEGAVLDLSLYPDARPRPCASRLRPSVPS